MSSGRRVRAIPRLTARAAHKKVLGIQRALMQRRRERWAQGRRNVTFVQIGAHDGGSGNDPLVRLIDADPTWRGVMVEPMPDRFRELTERRGGSDQIQLVQAAISDRSGSVEMFTVDASPSMPSWVNQLSSFDRQVIMKHAHAVPGLEERIRRIEVEAMTWPNLLATAGIEQVDLLHIDTEGHDAVVLDQVDLAVARPGLVQFEHLHLDPAEVDRCRRRLKQAGYRLAADHRDTLAVLKR